MTLPHTKENGTIIEIEWEQGDQYDDAGDGHCFMYHATGFGADGTEWIGSWIEVDGEFDDVTDIEENMETKTKNKAIADFMGKNQKYEATEEIFIDNLDYHKSFDSLVPVYRKLNIELISTDISRAHELCYNLISKLTTSGI